MGRILDRVIGIRSLVTVYLITFLWGLAAILASHFDHGGMWVHRRIVRHWARIVLSVAGIRLDVKGLEHLKAEDGPYVLVANHQSQLDIPILVLSIPLQLRFMGKIELSRIPVFGAAATRAGHIFIDRSNHDKSIVGVRHAAEKARNLGVSVVFAAEGTRSADGRLGAFKKGAFVMAIESGLPVLPVVIHGSGACLPKDSLLPKKGLVRVRVLPPVRTSLLAYGDRDRLRDQVRDGMAEELERLNS